MGQLTSSRSPHAGDLLSQSHKSCGDVHSPPPPASPAPCPQEQWGWAAKAPGWEVMASHWAARFGGRSHGLYCTEPKAGLLLPPAILAGNLGISARGASEGFPLQKLTFHSLFFSSFFFLFFFLFHTERDRTVWKINCTGLRVMRVRACERLYTGSVLDFTAVAFILGTEVAT